MRRAVYLDRDGVLVAAKVRQGKPYAPRNLAEFTILPDAKRSCTRLKRAGFFLVVVTNQPDVGNGLVAHSEVAAMHDVLSAELPVDAVRTCFHAQHEGCECRKPKPGLLLGAAREFSLDPTASFMIGDRWLDVVAGKSAGCKSILIDKGYCEERALKPNAIVQSLDEAVDVVLNYCCPG